MRGEDQWPSAECTHIENIFAVSSVAAKIFGTTSDFRVTRYRNWVPFQSNILLVLAIRKLLDGVVSFSGQPCDLRLQATSSGSSGTGRHFRPYFCMPSFFSSFMCPGRLMKVGLSLHPASKSSFRASLSRIAIRFNSSFQLRCHSLLLSASLKGVNNWFRVNVPFNACSKHVFTPLSR